MILLSTPLSEKMTRALSIELCIPHCSIVLHRFPGGEMDLSIDLPYVKGHHVLLVHSLQGAMHDQWMILFFLARRIKQLGALYLTVLLPYMAYARQDKSREGYVPFDLIPQILHVCGIDGLLTLDLHVSHLKTLFPIDVIEIEPHLLFAPLLRNEQAPFLIVSPDKGGQIRAQHLAQTLGSPWIYMMKKRTPEKGVLIDKSQNLPVRGTQCIIVDDILDTGQTLSVAVESLKQQGAVQVSACVTHGLFAPSCLERLERAGLDRLYISDSFPVQEDVPAWMSIVPIAPLVGEYIKNTEGLFL